MSDQSPSTSPTRQRKIMIGIGLLFILCVLPGISWFYLSGGLKWRKDAMGELGSYGKVRGAFIIYPDGTKMDQLKSNVCVLHIFGENPDLTDDNKRIVETYERLNDQFGMAAGSVRQGFRLVMIYEGGTAEFRSKVQTIPSIDNATWVTSGGLGSWRTIVENGYQKFQLEKGVTPAKEYFALADTSGQIRRFYNALDDDQVNRMVQQIALLLPAQ